MHPETGIPYSTFSAPIFAEEDIFVHRTNLMGSAPGVHIDLQEGSKVRFWCLHGSLRIVRV